MDNSTWLVDHVAREESLAEIQFKPRRMVEIINNLSYVHKVLRAKLQRTQTAQSFKGSHATRDGAASLRTWSSTSTLVELEPSQTKSLDRLGCECVFESNCREGHYLETVESKLGKRRNFRVQILDFRCLFELGLEFLSARLASLTSPDILAPAGATHDNVSG